MNRRRETGRGRGLRVLGLCLVGIATLPAGMVRAADIRERFSPSYGSEAPQGSFVEIEPPPRYFPRAEGDSTPPRFRVERHRRIACVPRRVPIPTDAPDDPSYVGSTYGLGKPSYYGIKPALGVDDPFGRSLLPYCN